MYSFNRVFNQSVNRSFFMESGSLVNPFLISPIFLSVVYLINISVGIDKKNAGIGRKKLSSYPKGLHAVFLNFITTLFVPCCLYLCCSCFPLSSPFLHGPCRHGGLLCKAYVNRKEWCGVGGRRYVISLKSVDWVFSFRSIGWEWEDLSAKGNNSFSTQFETPLS